MRLKKNGIKAAKDIGFQKTNFTSQGQPVSKWHKATFDTIENSVEYHLARHGNRRTLEQYTNDAMYFFKKNKKLGTEVTLKNETKGIKIQAGTGKNKVGGYWTHDEKLNSILESIKEQSESVKTIVKYKKSLDELVKIIKIIEGLSV